jgi:Tfp pilus assembly ATPase PilU
MVTNSRIAELIRENKPEYIPEAIADGAFSQMQTLSDALIALVLSGDVDRETAANAAPNKHDFDIALSHALKEQAVESTAGEQHEAEVAAAPAPHQPLPDPLDAIGSLRIV